MQDEATTTDATPDDDTDEQAEALSRAARDAVRQPADPRLERSFARLGLFSDDPPAAIHERRAAVSHDTTSVAEATPVPPAPSVDLEPLRAEVAALQAVAADLQAAVGRVERRLGTATLVNGALLATVAVLAVIVLVRP